MINGAMPAAAPADHASVVDQYLSGLTRPTDDPAFQEPVDATDANTKARARLVYRDNPLVTIQNTWSIPEARSALFQHAIGIFFASGMLCDSIIGDDRVTSTLNSRASAVFGREPRFKAADSSDAAKKCLQAWEDWWPRLSGGSAMREMQDYATMMGFHHSQILWDTTQTTAAFCPHLRPWHPVFEYYDWYLRRYMAIGQDAVIPIVPGNGKWIEHTPFGSYRGWIRGAIRPVVEPWMLRHYGFRDMARFGEVHGNPTRKGKVPMVGDPKERQDFEAALANLGADAALIVPTGVDVNDGNGYDYELVEARSQSWQVHPAQIDRCDMAIVLALLMVSLETEVDSGGAWGAKSKMDIRSEGAQLDNQSWKMTIYRDLARPFAFLNFGDANLAPWTWYDVVGRDEYKNNASQFKEFGNGLMSMARAGLKFKDAKELQQYAKDRFGLAGLPDFEIGDPQAGSGAGSGAGGGGGFGQ